MSTVLSPGFGLLAPSRPAWPRGSLGEARARGLADHGACRARSLTGHTRGVRGMGVTGKTRPPRAAAKRARVSEPGPASSTLISSGSDSDSDDSDEDYKAPPEEAQPGKKKAGRPRKRAKAGAGDAGGATAPPSAGGGAGPAPKKARKKIECSYCGQQTGHRITTCPAWKAEDKTLLANANS